MPKRWQTLIGKNRLIDFKKINCIHLCKKINAKTFLLIGGDEAKKFPSLVHRVHTAQKYIQKSKLVTIPHAKHDIGQKEYIAGITNTLPN